MDILCLEFMNSRWFNSHKPFEECLKNKKWMEEFCEKWELPVPDITEHTLDVLLEFREFLYSAITELCLERTISAKRLNRINKCLERGALQKRLRHEGGAFYLEEVPQVRGLELMLFRIALSFAELAADHRLDYLRQCENPDCDWIFYDDSKSHTRKWCDNKCASLMKVRKYRSKQKAGE